MKKVNLVFLMALVNIGCNNSTENFCFSRIEVMIDQSSVLTDSHLEESLIRDRIEKHLKKAGAKLDVNGAPSLKIFSAVRYLNEKGEPTVGKGGRPVDMIIIAKSSKGTLAAGKAGIAYSNLPGMIDRATREVVQSLVNQKK